MASSVTTRVVASFACGVQTDRARRGAVRRCDAAVLAAVARCERAVARARLKGGLEARLSWREYDLFETEARDTVLRDLRFAALAAAAVQKGGSVVLRRCRQTPCALSRVGARWLGVDVLGVRALSLSLSLSRVGAALDGSLFSAKF